MTLERRRLLLGARQALLMSGPPALFDPDTISGMALWLDPASGITITSSPDVDSWTDKKSGYVLSQSTAAAKPHFNSNAQNGKPGVVFDGTDDILRRDLRTLVGNTGCIFAAIINEGSGQADRAVFASSDVDLGGAVHFSLRAQNNNTDEHWAIGQRDNDTADVVTGNEVLGTSEVNLLMVQSDGSSYRLRRNGYDVVELATGGTNSGDWFADDAANNRDNISVGGITQFGGDSFFFNGTLLELIIYEDVTLTSDQIRSVEDDYFNAKYNIYTAKNQTARTIASPTIWLWGGAGVALNATTVSDWADQSNNAYDFSQATATKQPTFDSSVQNGKPGLDFDGSDDILVHAAGVLTGSSGAVFVVCKLDAVGSIADVVGSSDEVGTNDFLTFDANFTTADPDAAAIRHRDAGTSTNVHGDTASSTSTVIVVYRSNGTSYSIRVNGAEETLTVQAGADDGDWFADITASLDNVTIGALKRTTEIEHFNGKILEVIIYDGVTISDADTSALESALNSEYAVY